MSEAGWLEKSFAVCRDAADVEDVSGIRCVRIIDAECETVAFVPLAYAKTVASALNAYSNTADPYVIEVEEGR